MGDVRAVTMPPLSTISGIDILATGTWRLGTGENTFTTEDLRSAVEAAACPAVGNPRLKLGHVDARFDGEPAVGYVANMALSSSGNKITGDLAGMPGWLGTPDAEGRTVIGSAYPNRSIEGVYDFTCQIEHVHPFVITAVALLGVTGPGVGVLGSLDDIAKLYGVSAGSMGVTPGRSWQLEVGVNAGGLVMAQGVTTDDVRRAYYGQSEVSYNMWICEMQLAPPQLIVCDDSTDKVYRVPVTIKGDKVTFGDAVEVEVEYVDVAAGVAAARGDYPGPAVRWGTIAASRSGIKATGEDPEPEPDVAAGDGHAPMSGSHSHGHSAYGSQGGDSTHEHAHTHGSGGSPDANHAHAHASAGNGEKGGSKVDFTDEQWTALRASLGLPEDAERTPAVVLTAAAALREQASKQVTASGGLPPGVITIDKTAWEGMQARVEAGEAFRKQTLKGQRDEVIMAAVRAGKFPKSEIERWQAVWDGNPDSTREVIASLRPNVVPVADVGIGGGSPDGLGEDEDYVRMFGTTASR